MTVNARSSTRGNLTDTLERDAAVAEELAHRGGGRVRVARLGDGADEARADDHPVRVRADGGRLLGCRDPEPHRDRDTSVRLRRLEEVREARGQLVALPCHARIGDEIDEALGPAGDLAPAASAAVAAPWITGPSASGSEKGTPSSTRSAPAST